MLDSENIDHFVRELAPYVTNAICLREERKATEELVKVVEIGDLEPLTVNDLRGVLGEQIRLLRTSKTTPSAANAVTNAAGKIFASIKLELELSKILGVPPRINMFQIEAKARSAK